MNNIDNKQKSLRVGFRLPRGKSWLFDVVIPVFLCAVTLLIFTAIADLILRGISEGRSFSDMFPLV